MSLIEQAAKRLEELRRAGVDVPGRHGVRSAPGRAGARRERARPPRRATHDRRGRSGDFAPAGARRARGTRQHAPVAADPSRPRAARRCGHRHARCTRLADRRRIPRRQAAAHRQRDRQGRNPDPQRQPDHDHQRVAGRGQELHRRQSRDEHRDGARSHRPARGRRRRAPVAAGHARTAGEPGLARPARRRSHRPERRHAAHRRRQALDPSVRHEASARDGAARERGHDAAARRHGEALRGPHHRVRFAAAARHHRVSRARDAHGAGRDRGRGAAHAAVRGAARPCHRSRPARSR